MIICVKNPNDSIKEQLEIINEDSIMAITKSIYKKYVVLLYANNG